MGLIARLYDVPPGKDECLLVFSHVLSCTQLTGLMAMRCTRAMRTESSSWSLRRPTLMLSVFRILAKSYGVIEISCAVAFNSPYKLARLEDGMVVWVRVQQ